MDTIVAERSLSLTYLRDPSNSELFDPCRILDDLSDGGPGNAILPWQNAFRMVEGDHLIFATGKSSGRCLGLLAARDLATEREPFLLLEAACAAPLAATANLLHRMIAFAMLRIAGSAAVPTVLAAFVQTPCWARELHELAQYLPAASLFPAAPDNRVIDLGMAALARRIARVVRPGARYDAATGLLRAPAGTRPVRQPPGIARMDETLFVLDLSAADETAILDAARKLYRARPRQPPRRGMADGLTRARTVQRQRRMRDATAL